MDEKLKKELKHKLIVLYRDMEDTIKTMKDNGISVQGKYYPTELSNYDNHPADLGSQMFDAEFGNALMIHEESLLREIRDAIKRIDTDGYGICDICGKEISAERLKAIPYARQCMECKDKSERDREIILKQRPVEELVWDAPMGRKYLNEREDDEYEGLDYLNDLEKYGSSDSPQDMGGYYDYEEYYTNEIDKQGIVDDLDQVSNDEYRRQLPD